MRLFGGVVLPALAAGLVLGALPGRAEARDYKLAKTPGFAAKIPATMKLVTHRKFGPDEHLGRWVFESPNKLMAFRVRIDNHPEGDFKKAAGEFYQKFVRRLSDIEKVKDEFTTVDGRPVHYQVFKALMAQGQFMREFLFFRMFTKTLTSNRVIAVSLAATEERLEEFMSIVNTVMESFDLAEAPAKGGKR